MERARRWRSKSVSSIKGTRQLQKQKAISRTSTDSRSYIDKNDHWEGMLTLELGRSSGQFTGIPMKKLLAEELSKTVESKRQSPSIVARLMGLEVMPPACHNRRQQKMSSGSQQKTDSVNCQRNSQLHDGRLSRRSSTEQQEFKDVHEDLEASHVVNPRCSSGWRGSSIGTIADVAFIQQEFIDARNLSTDEKFQNSTEVNDTSEMLDSLLGNRLPDHKVDPGRSVGNHILVLKPLNSAIYRSKEKAWGYQGATWNKHHNFYHVKHEDDLLQEPHNCHRAHISCHLSRFQLDEKNEQSKFPKKVVLRKPNLEKSGSSSSPNPSHGYHLSCKKNEEFPDIRGAETLPQAWENSHGGGFPMPISKKSRDIARDITTKMRNGCDVTWNGDTCSVGFRGYVGDESSCDSTDRDSESESEVFTLSCREFFNGNSLCRCPSSHRGESSVTKEAKKRLSERCKITAVTWNPLGISTSDGRKDDILRNLSRSRSRPFPPSRVGRSPKRSPYCDELSQDKPMIHSGPVNHGKCKAVKGHFSHKEHNSPKDSKPRTKKHYSDQRMFINKTNSSAGANFEIQMEANTTAVPELQSVFQIPAEENTLTRPIPHVMLIAKYESPGLPSKFPELNSKPLPSIVDGENSSTDDMENSTLQELPKGTPEQGSPFLQCFGTEHDPSDSLKETDHRSPVSVLEDPFAEDTPSSYDCFERVSAELRELRMQLQLLKMESGECTNPPTVSPIEEQMTQPSPVGSGSGENLALGAKGWEISYTCDILTSSGLQDSDFDMFRTTWYSPDCPLEPNLFNTLENKFKNDTGEMRSERRLLFDSINSAVLEIFNEHVEHLYPWVMPNMGKSSKRKEGVGDVLEKIMREFGQGWISSDGAVLQWEESKGEIEVIGYEIEELLIDGILTELVGLMI